MNLPSSIGLVVPVAGSATQGEYAVVEACLPAGLEIPAHVASREDVTVHVLHGEVEVSVDRTANTLSGGESVAIRRGVPRRLRATRPSRVVAILTPGGLEQILAVIADITTDPDDRAALLAVGGVQAVPAA